MVYFASAPHKAYAMHFTDTYETILRGGFGFLCVCVSKRKTVSESWNGRLIENWGNKILGQIEKSLGKQNIQLISTKRRHRIHRINAALTQRYIVFDYYYFLCVLIPHCRFFALPAAARTQNMKCICWHSWNQKSTIWNIASWNINGFQCQLCIYENGKRIIA